MRKRKTTPKLPDWFSLEKYYGNGKENKMRNITIEEWYFQIFRRLEAQDQEDKEKRIEKFRQIWEDPLGGLKPKDKTRPEVSKFKWNQGSVRVAGYNAYLQLRELKKQVKKRMTMSELFHSPLELLADVNMLDLQSYRGTGLVVDLRVSDKQLIARFATLLKFLRTNEPWKFINPVKFTGLPESFFDRGVLPYWDLESWKNECKGDLTYEEIGKSILADEEIGSEDVRKTTKKWAEQIFSYEYLAAMNDFLKREEKSQK